jgi:hypothetical protein
MRNKTGDKLAGKDDLLTRFLADFVKSLKTKQVHGIFFLIFGNAKNRTRTRWATSVKFREQFSFLHAPSLVIEILLRMRSEFLPG